MTNRSLKNKCVPSKQQHNARNDFNIIPSGELHYDGSLDQFKQKVFKDQLKREWHQLKWYHSIFHNPAKNIKLQYYHSDDDPNIETSSEIIVNKKMIKYIDDDETIHPIYIFDGSYNYKDFRKSNHFAHFMADILPNVLYCSCVGK